MTETPFTQFIALVEMDQSINLLNDSIKKLENDKKQLEVTVITLQTQVTTTKEKYLEARKQVDAQELEMKRLDEQEKEKKSRLDAITSHKEYQSIKTEIDQLKKSQHLLEEELIQAWNKLEQAKKEYESTKQTNEQKIQEIQQLISISNARAQEIQNEITQKEKERNEKEKNIPQEWLEKYHIMRARVTNPVVPVMDSSCSACFYKINPQDMQSLQRNKLVQCKDCYRLLYIGQSGQQAS